MTDINELAQRRTLLACDSLMLHSFTLFILSLIPLYCSALHCTFYFAAFCLLSFSFRLYRRQQESRAIARMTA